MKQARYYEQTMYLAWKAGARVAIALQIRDAPNSDKALHTKTGIYFHNGKAKPAVKAFRFPFVADRRSRKKVELWGKAPQSGKVVIERKHHHKWRRVDRVHVGGNRVFSDKVHLKGSAKLRARAAGQRSLTWHLR